LNKAVLAILVLITASAVLISCGSYNSSTVNNPSPSGSQFRVFVSNPLFPAGTSTAPVLNVVDALKDLLLSSVVSVGSSVPTPSLMVVFPNKRFTLVLSASNNAIVLVNNSSQSLAQNSSNNTISIVLPGPTESIAIAPDNIRGYAAVPGVAVTGQSPGAVEALDLSSGLVAAGIPVSGARFLAQSHNGNRLLAFGGRADTVTLIAPSSIGTSVDPRTDIQSPLFDHPVGALFSSGDSTAYVLNCGPECGGSQASVTLLDMNSDLPGQSIPVDAATVGLLSGNTLYLAGTRPGANTCANSVTPTLATTCGEVSVVDLGSMTVTATATITDGYHDRMEMGANGQLFIGAHTCTSINAPSSGSTPGEVHGCGSGNPGGRHRNSAHQPPQRRLRCPEWGAQHFRHLYRQAAGHTGGHHRPGRRCEAGGLMKAVVGHLLSVVSHEQSGKGRGYSACCIECVAVMPESKTGAEG
jgi:hypothetical protein